MEILQNKKKIYPSLRINNLNLTIVKWIREILSHPIKKIVKNELFST